MSSFFREWLENYRKQRAFRWFVVTFPKTTGLCVVGITGLLGYHYQTAIDAYRKENLVKTRALHSADNSTLRTSGMLIYDGNADKKPSTAASQHKN